MKLFKLLIVTVALIAIDAHAYTRFKYEKELTRFYHNPGIRPDPAVLNKIAKELSVLHKQFEHSERFLSHREVFTWATYIKRIHTMFLECITTWAALDACDQEKAYK